jgi:hypothetical protein
MVNDPRPGNLTAGRLRAALEGAQDGTVVALTLSAEDRERIVALPDWPGESFYALRLTKGHHGEPTVQFRMQYDPEAGEPVSSEKADE